MSLAVLTAAYSSNPMSNPQTPQLNRRSRYRPASSSPLTWEHPSSPISMEKSSRHHISNLERRKIQFKASGSISSRVFTSPDSRPSSLSPATRSSSASLRPGPVDPEISPSSALLKEKFRARIMEKASQERRKKVAATQGRLRDAHRQRKIALSSDGFDGDMDMDEEQDDDDEEIYDDELFRRIITSVNRREQQALYRHTYSRDVGSSFDPAMEDPDRWEMELNQTFTHEQDYLEELLDPDEELAAYAADAAAQEMMDPLLEEMFDDDLFDSLASEDLDSATLDPSILTEATDHGMDTS